jgi:uncharacterized protein YuzE
MILRGELDNPKSKYNGKKYAFDIEADALYIRVREENSVYSDFVESGGEIATVDYDKDGNVVGVTLERVIERAMEKKLSWKLRLSWELLRWHAVMPAMIVTKTAGSLIKRAIDRIPDLNSHQDYAYA